jgi:peptide/nickel transport system permease protein
MAIATRVSGASARHLNLANLLVGLGWRLGQLVVMLWVISTLLFFLIRLTGDPADLLAGQNATPASVQSIRERYGLADPLPVQYVRFVWGAVRLDFGKSIAADVPAMSLVLERLPATGLLALSTMVLSIVIAVPLGTLAAVNRGKVLDRIVSMIVALGQSVPSFVFGLLLIFFFAVNLKWLPTFGQDGPEYLVLPTLTLSMGFIALLTRLTRSSLLEVMSQDYVRTARSKGLSNLIVLVRHALRNTMLTILTVLGLQLSILLGGAVVVEQLFSWPGIGQKILTAINSRDYPVVQAGVFVIALIVFLVNAAVDLLYRLADPRVR